MIIDIIRYKLAPSIDETFLLTSASDILKTWMKKQKGFIKWEITKTENEYIDFVYWESQEDIQLAHSKMSEIPKDHNWLKCYDMTSVKAEKSHVLFNESV